MQKYRFPMNLQLFAVDDDGVDDKDVPSDQDDPAKGKPPGAPPSSEDDDFGDDYEIDFGDDDEDEDPDADLDDPAGADPEDSDKQPPPDDKGKGDNPTANAVIAERRKWQEKLKAVEAQAALAQKIMKQTGVNDAAELERRLDAIEAQKLKAQGVPEELATALVTQQRQLADMQASIRKQKYEGEAALLKSDPFYADLDDHFEELVDLADRTGMTLKQTYNALHGERRMKEREAEIEARVKANQSKRSSKAVNTAQTGAAKQQSSKSLGLTPEQLAAAKHGVKRGLFKSVEEYARLLKR